MPNPYAAYTDSTEFVANYVLNAIKAGAATLGLTDAVNQVWYGDQVLLPETPAVCVVPGPETDTPNGAGGRPVRIDFRTFVMVYYGKVQDQQLNVHASLGLANQIKRLMNADPTLGGNAIDAYFSNIDPGVSAKQGGLMDATRMTLLTKSKVVLNP